MANFGEPWSNYDGVEIDFVIQYRHLTDEGYNVLTYDISNHGNSSGANNGICGIGRWERRDCVGSEVNSADERSCRAQITSARLLQGRGKFHTLGS